MMTTCLIVAPDTGMGVGDGVGIGTGGGPPEVLPPPPHPASATHPAATPATICVRIMLDSTAIGSRRSLKLHYRQAAGPARARFALDSPPSGNRCAIVDGAEPLPWNIHLAASGITAALT